MLKIRDTLHQIVFNHTLEPFYTSQYVLIKKPSTPPPKKPIYIFLKIKKNHERSKCVNKISVHGLNRILFIKWCLSNGR